MNPVNATTSLTGKKEGMAFELAVKIEGVPAKVYKEEEMDDGGSQAWIASLEGKRYTVHTQVKNAEVVRRTAYSSILVKIFSDGNYVDGAFSDDLVNPGSSTQLDHLGMRLSKDLVQGMTYFAKPVLSENAASVAAREKLSTIEAVFYRCNIYEDVPYTRSFARDRAIMKPINEKAVKGKVGAVTKFGEVTVSPVTTSCRYHTHPDDIEHGFFRLQLRYGPEDLLHALGHIPLRIIAKDGVTGLNKKQPILCSSDDDSEMEDDKTINISTRSRKASKRKAIDVDAEDESGDDGVPPETARELSKLKAKLKALKEMAQVQAEIDALEQGLGKKRKTDVAGPSKTKDNKADDAGPSKTNKAEALKKLRGKRK